MSSLVFDMQPHLIGELLELRPLRECDFPRLLAAASDPLIWEQHPDSRHREDVFRTFFAGQLESGGGLLALDRRTGEVVGTSRFFRYKPQLSEIEIGFTFLVRRCWGGTYNGEMKSLMLNHGFRYVENVVFCVNPNNIRSQRAVEKIGGVRFGSRIDARGRDSVAFQITSSAWTTPGFQLRRLEYIVCDVFAERPLAGNPLAVFPDGERVPEQLMQPLARELNLSEAVFVEASVAADARLRIFTPLRELPFAGHPRRRCRYCRNGKSEPRCARDRDRPHRRRR